MTTAYYYRASSKSQDLKSQEPDMEAHAASEPNAVFYRDKFTGDAGAAWLESLVGGRAGGGGWIGLAARCRGCRGCLRNSSNGGSGS
jgi:hypothetical protein